MRFKITHLPIFKPINFLFNMKKSLFFFTLLLFAMNMIHAQSNRATSFNLEKNLAEINKKYLKINHTYDNLLLRLMFFQQTLKKEKAHEYLMQGVGRRLKTLARCINNIFITFPPNQVEHLSKEALTDIDINLHAFFINVAGVFDNLAWVFVYENGLLGKSKEGRIPRNRVGLFYEETQKHLKTELRDYLNTDSMKSWYESYSKNYRDTLAHRIPFICATQLVKRS